MVASTTPTGRKISCPGGYEAFVPDPLPPALAWDADLVNAISAADRLVGRLAGEGSRLPDPKLLMRPFLRREAVLSSRIEGTQATLGELLAAEAGATVDGDPADLREVANYVHALEHGMRRLKSLPLSLRLMRELHQKLMSGVRGDRATPGEFRTTQNWIGPPGSTIATASFVPPPASELMPCLGDWEKFLHDRSLPPLVQAALQHVQFEVIHPFLDGNGRVGRLMITLFLIEREVLPTPLLYLSAYFEATRSDYYDGLLGVSERGRWREWLLYFLRGVTLQAEDTLSRVERLNRLLDKWRVLAAEHGSANAVRLVERLAANPYTMTRKVSRQLSIAFTTAQRAIKTLEELGVLQQVGEVRRDRLYRAQALMKILDEPAKRVSQQTAGGR